MTDLQKEKITELRKNGESISSIAEKMNLSVNSVKSFCRRKDVSPMKDGCKRCGQPLVRKRFVLLPAVRSIGGKTATL